MGNCYFKNYDENKKLNILILNEELKNKSIENSENIIDKLNNNDFFILFNKENFEYINYKVKYKKSTTKNLYKIKRGTNNINQF